MISKGIFRSPWATSLGPINLFAVINMLSFLCLLPWVAVLDGPVLASLVPQVCCFYRATTVMHMLFPYCCYVILLTMFQVASAGVGSLYPLLQSIFLSGLSFYIYNEASFVALSQLTPVTHSVVNTLKRVIIILVSCAVFQVTTIIILLCNVNRPQ